jgi:hypothetical protein
VTPRALTHRTIVGQAASWPGATAEPLPFSSAAKYGWAIACGLFLGAFFGVQSSRGDDVAPLGRFDLAPYRVTVRMTFAPGPTVTPALRRSVVSSLTSRIVQTFGGAWSLLPADRQTVSEDDELTPPNESGLERLTYAAVAQQLGAVPCDKAYLFVVRPEGPRWLIAGREWDRTLQSLGPVSSAATFDRREIADAALGLLQRLFSPLLIVDDADRESKTVTLTVRAGSIPLGDPHYAPLKKGGILRPVFRFLDAKGSVRKVQPVPWTYLVLEEIKNGHAKCTVASPYRAPLAANMRRRVDAVAVLLRPEFPETRLKLVVGRTVQRPLAGVFVEWRPMVPDQAEKTADAAEWQELLSDRSGAVTIPVDSQQPLRQLEVHSGSAILARRPLMPGVDAEVTLELPDDEVRLNAQRDVDLLRVQLVETVARRAALIGRTRASVKNSDAAAARRLLTELEQLPAADFYLAKLNEIRVVSLEEAHRRKDHTSEKRIDDLCQKTGGLIEQYLPDDRLRTVREEVTTALAEAQKPPPAKEVVAPAPKRRSKPKPPAVPQQRPGF